MNTTSCAAVMHHSMRILKLFLVMVIGLVWCGPSWGLTLPAVVSDAGPDQIVSVNSLVTLDGSGSTGPAGAALTYTWSFLSRPNGSTAALSDPTIVNPSFTPDVPGIYLLELVASAISGGTRRSSTDQVTVSASTRTSIGEGGITIVPGSVTQTTLDLTAALPSDATGTVSFQQSTDGIQYFTVASGVPLVAGQATNNITGLTAGTLYYFRFTYSGDSAYYPWTSPPVSVTTARTPVPLSGWSIVPDSVTQNTVHLTATVLPSDATGTVSFQRSTDGVEYFTVASGVSLVAGQARFNIDGLWPGTTYFFRFIYSGDSTYLPLTSNSVTVWTLDTLPPWAVVSDAGLDQSVHTGRLVTLDGSGSTGPAGAALTYTWSIREKPYGSTAALSDPALVNPTFAPDLPGSYVIQLDVSTTYGSQFLAQSDQVIISALNSAPIAEAGPAQALYVVGTPVSLDGNQSYDPDGDLIGHDWAFASRPDGSNAILNNANTATPSFQPDMYGTYSIMLTVSDPWAQSSDTVNVSFENIQPVANAGTSGSARVGETITLDGSASSDANGDPLLFNWVITSLPQGSAASLSNPTAAATTFVPDIAGRYVVQLVVNDGLVDSSPSAIEIQVVGCPTTPTEAVKDVQNAVASLKASSFKNANMRKSLNNKLNAVIAGIEAGNYADVLGKLRDDILSKTDGCVGSGSPDSVDWIKDCDAQGQVYPLILRAIEILQSQDWQACM